MIPGHIPDGQVNSGKNLRNQPVRLFVGIGRYVAGMDYKGGLKG